MLPFITISLGIAERLNAKLAKKAEILGCDARVHPDMMKQVRNDTNISSKKARDLGWKSTIGLWEGLFATIQWQREQGLFGDETFRRHCNNLEAYAFMIAMTIVSAILGIAILADVSPASGTMQFACLMSSAVAIYCGSRFLYRLLLPLISLADHDTWSRPKRANK
jgi:hypothetical protein